MTADWNLQIGSCGAEIYCKIPVDIYKCEIAKTIVHATCAISGLHFTNLIGFWLLCKFISVLQSMQLSSRLAASEDIAKTICTDSSYFTILKFILIFGETNGTEPLILRFQNVIVLAQVQNITEGVLLDICQQPLLL